MRLSADKVQKQPEFFDFLRVNNDSNKSELTDCTRIDDDEVNQGANADDHHPEKGDIPFFDFLSVG